MIYFIFSWKDYATVVISFFNILFNISSEYNDIVINFKFQFVCYQDREVWVKQLRNNYCEIIAFSNKWQQFVMFSQFFLNKFLSLASLQNQLELSFMNTYNFKGQSFSSVFAFSCSSIPFASNWTNYIQLLFYNCEFYLWRMTIYSHINIYPIYVT